MVLLVGGIPDDAVQNYSVSWAELIPIGPRREQVNDYRMLFILTNQCCIFLLSLCFFFFFFFSWVVSEGDVEG